MMKQKSRSGEKPDLESTIHDHLMFFDKLIELIPARFYLPIDESEKPWFQGLSKAKKTSLKQKTRENIKKARRDRLDPEKSSSTTLDLLKESWENEKIDFQVEDDEATVKPIKPKLEKGSSDQSVTYEELQERLRRKLEEFRSGRGGSDKVRKIEKKADRQKKRKRETNPEETLDGAKGSNLPNEDAELAAKELAFGKVKLDNEEGGRKKKKKLPKEKELERARRLEDAKKDPERGEIVAKKHSWKAATTRAAGIKVHDNPKLIKQSLQKEKKRHEKNAEKWKDRAETREKLREEKQQARAGNIAERIQQKKMRKIAKREKKLMRPGFEGRKDGYINEDKS